MRPWPAWGWRWPPGEREAEAQWVEWPKGSSPAEIGKRVAERFVATSLILMLLEYQTDVGMWRQLLDRARVAAGDFRTGMFTISLVACHDIHILCPAQYSLLPDQFNQSSQSACVHVGFLTQLKAP